MRMSLFLAFTNSSRGKTSSLRGCGMYKVRFYSVCAVCGKKLGFKLGNSNKPGDRISHGYCEKCKEMALAEIRNYKPKRKEI